MSLSDLLRPAFSSPRVGALMSTRAGGVSRAPFDALNLRPEVGDDPAAVAENRRRLVAATGTEPVRLDQVHGAELVVLDAALQAANRRGALPRADASLSLTPRLACEVQVADCLPVLFAHRDGLGVAAAHAGWRGLAGGIVEHTLARLCAACGGAAPHQIEVWLGACIGPERFEVGADVLQAFGASADQPGARFVPGVPGKWLADLAGLARDRLAAAGVRQLLGNDSGPAWCTFNNSSRFFSFRRERVTGRMSALVWLRG